MAKLKDLLRKGKWYLITLTLLLTSSFWLNKKLTNDSKFLEYYTFTTFIAREYMVDQRHSTQKWPSDLAGLAAYIKMGHRVSSLYEMRNLILRYSRDRYLRIEIIQVCANGCVYRIHTKDFVRTCQSTVNPDYGNCYSDSG